MQNRWRLVLTQHVGRFFDFTLVDFTIVSSNISLHPELHLRIRRFRDALITKFVGEDPTNHRQYKWMIFLIWPAIYDDVKKFLRILRENSEEHSVVFISFDDITPPRDVEVADLRRRYPYQTFFALNPATTNYTEIFRYLQENDELQQIPRNVDRSYPLQLYANSISSGLCFNYYFSYLNRQVGSTNNIVLLLISKEAQPKDLFPSKLHIQLKTEIEAEYLSPHPSSYSSRDADELTVNLQLDFDHSVYTVRDDGETRVKYFVCGVQDFGRSVRQLTILYEKFDPKQLKSIELKDDVRQWNFCYDQPYYLESDGIVFYQKDGVLQRCCFVARDNNSTISPGHPGVCTLKYTNKECSERYQRDRKDPRIREYRIIPTYYLIADSSCDFGRADRDGSLSEGIIKDPDFPDRIQLARLSNGEVLRSAPMHHYNRYLRRTYYYIDQDLENGQVIRYLFCAEYPYILSTLYQMEKQGLITAAQKREEYFRFCNMLERILKQENLTDSIKLIKLDRQDRSATYTYANDQPPWLWKQIQDDIQRWYDKVDQPSLAEFDIDDSICFKSTKPSVVIFHSENNDSDPLATREFLRALQDKLIDEKYRNPQETDEIGRIQEYDQAIFICGNNEDLNKNLIREVSSRMEKKNALKDVFIFLDQALEHFPATFIRMIPFITVYHHQFQGKVNEVLHYLQNMNIMSAANPDTLLMPSDDPDQQVTSIGQGCAAAFFFNYLRILCEHLQHLNRMETVRQRFHADPSRRQGENQAIFLPKWIFILPWTIENCNNLIDDSMKLTDNGGIHLSFWTRSDGQIELTIGGIVGRSYSPLTIYRLSNDNDPRTFYFPMEIPAALFGLQNQYRSIATKFNFGQCDPIEQATTFRENVLEYQRRALNEAFLENVVLIPLLQPNLSSDAKRTEDRHREHAKSLLQTLWDTLVRL